MAATLDDISTLLRSDAKAAPKKNIAALVAAIVVSALKKNRARRPFGKRDAAAFLHEPLSVVSKDATHADTKRMLLSREPKTDCCDV